MEAYYYWAIIIILCMGCLIAFCMLAPTKEAMRWVLRAPLILVLVVMIQLSGIAIYILAMQQGYMRPYQSIDVVPTFQDNN